ncbi:MAG: hypothetical protein ACSLE1_19855 [Sphingobium sp.]
MAFLVRLAAATAGTRVAAAAGRYGVVGTAAGLLVTSAVLRWPGKALMLGAAYGARKLWLKQNEPVALLEDQSQKPLVLEETRVSQAAI